MSTTQPMGDVGFAAIASFAEWPRELDVAEHVLFVAADARDATDAAIREAARRAIKAGARYVVTWGPDCERVHDRFDDVICEEHPGETIITTWHADEPLADALWFFLEVASPAEAAGRTRVAVAVGRLAVQVESALRAPPPAGADGV